MLQHILRELARRHRLVKMRKNFRKMQKGNLGRVVPCLESLEDRCLLTALMSQFSVPTSRSNPLGITTGADGNVWFTEAKGNQIGEIDTATQSVNEFPVPTSSSAPYGITAGPDGNIWFTESNGNQIGELDLTTDAITEFPVPTAGSLPLMIVPGADGYLFFTEGQGNQIGVINPATGSISEIAVPTAGSFPQGIAAGPDGNIWFTENTASQIGELNITTGAISEFPTPTSGSGPLGIAAGADGNVWFTENNTNQIGCINPATGAITEFALPAAGMRPVWMSAGADGNVWFSEMSNTQLGFINPPSQIIHLINTAGAGAAPVMLAPGANGSFWLSEPGSNQIGQLPIAPGLAGNPHNSVIDAGQSTSFTATAQGGIAASVQWVVSTNGGQSFFPLIEGGVYSGVNGDTLTITGPTTALNGYEYAAWFINGTYPGPAVLSKFALLAVKPALSITPALPQATAGTSYNHALTVSGGLKPYTTFTVTGFDPGSTGLTPAAIVLHPATGIVTVSGTPSTPGTATFTVNVIDTTGAMLSKAFTLTVTAPPTIGTLTASPWTAGKSGFTGTMVVAGGNVPFTIIGRTGLPPGVTASVNGTTITLAGTPTQAKTFAGTITIRDAAGALATQAFSITINPAVTITALAATQWTVNQPGFPGTMTLTGGTGALSVLHVSGLPTGLSAVVNGNTISFVGTPTKAKVFTAGSITVQDSVGATFTRLFHITINPAPTVSALRITKWTVSKPGFTGTMIIGGGTGPFTISATSELPTGLSAVLKGRTISFLGRPSVAQAFASSITIQDTAGASVTQTFTITIVPVVAPRKKPS